MPISDKRLLQLAIDALEGKRQSIDEELSQLRSRMGSKGKPSQGEEKKGNGRRRRRRMTAAQKKEVSERMKKMWAERKKGKK